MNRSAKGTAERKTVSEARLSMLFLGKADDPYSARALEYCQSHFDPVVSCLGRWGDTLPDGARLWRGDYIISYLSRWIVPDTLLTSARKAAINFHPASPDYPGIGCNNFALYEDASAYGVTCHHMAPHVDTGEIIAVRKFPILPEDTVGTLLARTYENQIALFFEIAAIMAAGRNLPVSSERWGRRPFTRREFNELFRITPVMSAEEIARRVRAVSYQGFQPYVELEGYRFEYKPAN